MTHNRSIQNDEDQPIRQTGISRRRVIDLAARASLVMGVTGSVVGCASTAQKRVRALGGSVGKPIPEDPVAEVAAPKPIRTTTGGRTHASVEPPLNQIPSFIHPRSSWTNESPIYRLADPMGTINRITVHHDAIMPVPSGSYADSLRRLQLIRKGHLNNGWADIGYHFAIDPSGRIWQARPLELQGAHVKDHNEGNLGIVMFGNYEMIRPTDASLRSLERMIAYAMQRFNIPLNRVFTHQELRPTACPGRNLQRQMIATRSSGGRLAQLVASGAAINA